MDSLRILIVDDHQAVRRGLRALLSARRDWLVCGEAGDGCEAVDRAKELRPDVILMDLSMPRMGGVEATRIIRRENPESKIIIVSQNDPAIVRQQARELGARAYVAKTDLARDLLPTIENIALGKNGESHSDDSHAKSNGKHLAGRHAVPLEAQLNAERLRSLFDSSALGVAVLDLDGRFLETNDSFCVITGYSQSELKGLDCANLIHPDDRERMHAQIKRLIAGDIPSFVIDQRYSRKSGRTVWAQNSVSLTRSHAGNALTVVMLCQEFTEHKRLLSQLRESEHRFREMIDALPVAIYTTDGDGRLTHFNPAAVEFSGHIPELGTMKWCVSWKLFYPDGRPMRHDECPMALTLKGGVSVDGTEAIAERPDGTRVWFTPFPRALHDAEGKIVGGINMLLDITERKQAERTTSLLASIVDSSDDAIASKRLDGVITSWNKSAERLFGYTAKEAVGRHIGLIIPRDRLTEEAAIIKRLKQGERVDHFETVRMRKDGALRDVSVTISPLKDSSGSVIGASKVARDITDRKRVEKKLSDRAREQNALFQLADHLHRATSLEDVYAAGLNAIFTASQCDRASILLCDDSGMMRFASWRGLSDMYRKVTEGHSPWPSKETDPAPICIDDIEGADLAEAIKVVVKAEGIAALAFIPLVSSGRVIGKFMMYFDAGHQFNEAEVDLSLTIARQIAFGIDRKRAEEALRASEERFRALSATLDAEVQIRTMELEQRNSELMWRSEQLRDVSRRMIRVQDAERRHIARELHDSAGQTLTVLGLNIAALAKKVSPELITEAEETLQLIQQLSQEIRTTSYLLHPPLLDESGLADALSWYVDGLMQRSKLDIGLLICEDFGRLSPDIELVIFRLVQECLTNIHRHSGSKSATIRLARRAESVSLEVQDFGKGIPSDKLEQIQAQGSGVGIRGMGERVRQFDGEMKIESNGSGTRILVTLPLATQSPTRKEGVAASLHAAN
jgi:PAS domain S-box-containing protein